MFVHSVIKDSIRMGLEKIVDVELCNIYQKKKNKKTNN